MSKTEYIQTVNDWNTVSGFKIILRDNLKSYHDLLSYKKDIQTKMEKAIFYEEMLKKGYYDEELEKELGLLVLEINQKTLNIHDKHITTSIRRKSI